MTRRCTRRVPAEVRAYLDGLTAMNVCFVRLRPETKHPDRVWSYFEELHAREGRSRIDLAMRWLETGHGVGFLPRGDLWILDLDGVSAKQRAEDFVIHRGVFGPRVRTPGGGLHLYFRLPADLDRVGLKAHVLHPRDADGLVVPWDFKLPGQTMVVAPGTMRNDLEYQPESPWTVPPIVDPCHLHPGLALFHSRPRFLPAGRSKMDRVIRGKQFLSTCRVSISGKGGHGVLANVAAHLVAYLQLDPALAYKLLAQPEGDSWNSRCRNRDGSPFPWSRKELWEALIRARDAVPAKGVLDYEAARKKESLNRHLECFIHGIHDSIGPGGVPVSTEDLHQRFLGLTGIDPELCSRNRFGRALMESGLKTRNATRAKIRVVDEVRIDLLPSAMPISPYTPP